MIRLIMAFFRRIKWLFYTLIMLCCRIFPVKKNKIIFENYRGKGYGDNGKYICEYLRENATGLDLVWVAKNMQEKLPAGVRAVPYMSLKYFWEMSTAKVWVDNCRKLSYIKKRKKQFYVQTWHGDIGPKKVEGEAVSDLYGSYVKASKRDSKMADLFVSGNSAFSKRYRTAFWYEGEIAECGYPRRDILFSITDEKINAIKEKVGVAEECKILLYAPTFRSGNMDLSVYSINWASVIKSLEKRFGGSFRVLVRLHPNISEQASKLKLSSDIVNVTDYPDMQELLAISDICISDYSSSIFEFAVTGKPGFIYAKDYQEYKKGREVLFQLDKIFFPFAETEEALQKCIEEFDQDEYKKGLDYFLHQQIGYYQEGHASEYIGKIILSKCGRP